MQRCSLYHVHKVHYGRTDRRTHTHMQGTTPALLYPHRNALRRDKKCTSILKYNKYLYIKLLLHSFTDFKFKGDNSHYLCHSNGASILLYYYITIICKHAKALLLISILIPFQNLTCFGVSSASCSHVWIQSKTNTRMLWRSLFWPSFLYRAQVGNIGPLWPLVLFFELTIKCW